MPNCCANITIAWLLSFFRRDQLCPRSDSLPMRKPAQVRAELPPLTWPRLGGVFVVPPSTGRTSFA
jgi:hypothetical protein